MYLCVCIIHFSQYLLNTYMPHVFCFEVTAIKINKLCFFTQVVQNLYF